MDRSLKYTVKELRLGEVSSNLKKKKTNVSKAIKYSSYIMYILLS